MNTTKDIEEELKRQLLNLKLGSQTEDGVLLAVMREIERARAEGQQNPKVGFLRQYLNENPDFSGPWTDEQILNFLQIPFEAARKGDVVEKRHSIDVNGNCNLGCC